MKQLLAFSLLVLFAAPVLAQDSPPALANETVRWNLAIAQLETSLDSEYQSVREQTLKNAIVLATLYRDKVDLAGQRSLLHKIYEESKSPKNRKLAVALLQAIGGNRAQDFLARNTTQAEFDEGRLTVASVLNDYYINHQNPVTG
ncbi:MAG: hypothetical protein F4246_01405 [Rhodothermaceae bacterium]|nr:hypothetical protein [Rhodothermaceae bacterium]MXX59257.1 hypothetical protein [Rhodothermaceae bacterium]MYD19293.1 hypothetical protein [Rhodothermaceae bacterium]MYD55652.1 hypothetical protein [Rhodothermaceae bacterium]MYI44722.1 hypothetical protein [Rhodothermaceae bacterium]